MSVSVRVCVHACNHRRVDTIYNNDQLSLACTSFCFSSPNKNLEENQWPTFLLRIKHTHTHTHRTTTTTTKLRQTLHDMLTDDGSQTVGNCLIFLFRLCVEEKRRRRSQASNNIQDDNSNTVYSTVYLFIYIYK